MRGVLTVSSSSPPPPSLRRRWGCKLNDAILAEDKHKPLYEKLAKTHPVEYIAGGATQNSIRVAQWMSGTAGTTAFVGCIGQDAFGDQLEKAARADGVNVNYMKQNKAETGTCAVLVKGGERSLCANLAAANCYDKAHFDTESIQALLKATRVVYIAGFFLTVSPPTIMAIGKEIAESGKTMCMNLSAPFIPQFFKEPLDAALYYVDFVFGNESEAAIYGEGMGWGKDVATVALKLAAMPKASGARPRVVVFTQGSDSTLVACGGVISAFPVPLLEKKDLVDTNGAGDAFVGGFLAKLAKGCDLAECVNAGHYSARQIIQVSGCKIPSFKPTV
jgi:adenosine kinase